MSDAAEAWIEIENKLQDVPPFRVELTDIEVFPITQVIYLSVSAGAFELRRLHRMLNTGSCAFAGFALYIPPRKPKPLVKPNS